MKYPDSILDACVARVHAAVLHEKAMHCKPLPDFSPIANAERKLARDNAQGNKWRATMKAKGAGRG